MKLFFSFLLKEYCKIKHFLLNYNHLILFSNLFDFGKLYKNLDLDVLEGELRIYV